MIIHPLPSIPSYESCMHGNNFTYLRISRSLCSTNHIDQSQKFSSRMKRYFILCTLCLLGDVALCSETTCYRECFRNSCHQSRRVGTLYSDNKNDSIISNPFIANLLVNSTCSSFLNKNDSDVTNGRISSFLLSDIDHKIRVILHELSTSFVVDVSSRVVNQSITQNNISTRSFVQILIPSEYINHSETNLSGGEAFKATFDTIINNVINEAVEYSDTSNETFPCSYKWSITKETVGKTLENRYCDNNPQSETRDVETCQIGCSLFFSSSSRPMYLSECFMSCERIYNYHDSLNHIVWSAKIDCMSGCLYGLQQCQPGFFCIQGKNAMSEDLMLHYSRGANQSGYMSPCPPGTFRTERDNSSVASCEPCPQGRYRDEIMGTTLDSCKQCPINTFGKKFGSISLSDCKPCPYGTFTNGKGFSACQCITPGACESI